MIDLYKNIKAKRLELGMTQDELAKKLGYSGKSMIAKIESGKVDLSQSKIIAFAKALDTDPGELMGNSQKEKRVVYITTPPIGRNEKNVLEKSVDNQGKMVFSVEKEKLINALMNTTSSLNKDGIKRIMEYAKELNDIDKYKDK